MDEPEEFNFADFDGKSMLEFQAMKLVNGYLDTFEHPDRELAKQLFADWVKKYHKEILD